MSISRQRRKKPELPKRDTSQIVSDLISEIYDQIAAEMVVALYRKKRDILQKVNNKN